MVNYMKYLKNKTFIGLSIIIIILTILLYYFVKYQEKIIINLVPVSSYPNPSFEIDNPSNQKY